jgi:hypothetical protein
MWRRRILFTVVAGFLATAAGAGFQYSPAETEDHHASGQDGFVVSTRRSLPARLSLHATFVKVCRTGSNVHIAPFYPKDEPAIRPVSSLLDIDCMLTV